jgi:hypothetical protein
VSEEYVLYQPEMVRSWMGAAATFRLPNSTVNYCTLWNPVGSGVLVAVRQAAINIHYATTSSTVRSIALMTVTSAPTGGTLLTPMSWDTTQTATGGIEFRSAASADDTASTITVTGVTRAWTQLHGHNPSSATLQWRMIDEQLLPVLAEKDPPTLRPGQGYVMRNMDSAPSTVAAYTANMVWEIYSLP